MEYNKLIRELTEIKGVNGFAEESNHDGPGEYIILSVCIKDISQEDLHKINRLLECQNFLKWTINYN
jgi:hypothetical protein